MFMLADKDAIISEYTAAVKKAEDRLLVMGNTQNYLERQMEECQKSLTEMSMANPTGKLSFQTSLLAAVATSYPCVPRTL